MHVKASGFIAIGDDGSRRLMSVIFLSAFIISGCNMSIHG